MTRLHHATISRSAKLGVTLSQDSDTDVVTAITAHGQTLTGSDPKHVAAIAMLAGTLAVEYPALSVNIAVNGEYHTYFRDQQEPFFIGPADETNEDNALADVLEAADDAGLDLDTDDDDVIARVVVALRYKLAYAERGDRNHCGDWLATTLKDQFQCVINDELRFDADAFEGCLLANGVELVGKWASLPTSGQKGWEGRYRMNGRQKLEMKIAVSKELVMHGETIPVPEDVLAVLWAKHPKTHPDNVKSDKRHPEAAEKSD